MSRRDGAPPRLARALLDALLPVEDRGAATGDLDEEYARYVLPTRSRASAALWYWRQVLLSSPRLLARRCARALGGLGSLGGDVRFAARVLRRRPGFTVAATATLGLALGVGTTVFSVVHAVLMQPLPFSDEGRLVRPVPGELFYLNAAQAAVLQERMTAFESFAAWGRTLFLFTGDAGAEEVRGGIVAWSHFEMLGARPLLGRTFVREDAVAGDAIVLSHGLWVRRFGADPRIVGATVDVSGRATRVVGVMGPDHVPMELDWEAWRTLPLDPRAAAGMGLAANGRLRPGVTLGQARDELRRVFGEMWAEAGHDATEDERAALQVVPLRSWLLGDARPGLLVLAGAVGFVLLLACANVASLLVAQSEGRGREFAVRAALGGARTRIARQLLVEVLLLSVLGGLAALSLSALSLGWFTARLPVDMPRVGQVSMSMPVVLFAAAGTLGVALLTGIVPALRAAGPAIGSLTRGGRGGFGPERVRLRSALVAAEVAVAVVLVVGAGLMVRTLASLRAVDPGFETEGVVTVRPSPPGAGYPAGSDLDAYYDELTTALAAIPGVRSVGAIQFLPMTPGGFWGSYVPEGRVSATEDDRPRTAVRVVREGYFETMRIPLLAGRTLTVPDGDHGAPWPVVVNRTFAAEAFGGADAVGRSLAALDTDLEIVGVVADVKQSDLRTGSHPEIYIPFDAVPWRRMHMVARFEGDERATLAAATDAVRGVDAQVSMLGPRPMGDVVGSTLGSARLLAGLLTLFGAVGLCLGAVGVYGVTAQSVTERRREIGIRMALGAEARGVTRATVRVGLRPVALGLTVGLAVALAATGLLDGLLFQVTSTDPATFATAPAILLAVALLSLLLPAVRASRVDPVRTLRDE